MLFVKGKSGNPRGRPRGTGTAQVRSLLKPHDRLLIQKLKDLLSHQDGKIQLEAVRLGFLYRWGKPAEQEKTSEATVEKHSPESEDFAATGELSQEQIRALQAMATGSNAEDYGPEDHPIGSAKQATTSQPPQLAREPAAAYRPLPPLSAAPSAPPPPAATAPSKDDPLQGCTPDERRIAVLAAIGYLPP